MRSSLSTRPFRSSRSDLEGEVNQSHTDLLNALAESPLEKLSTCDDAFLFLESGLGAIFSPGLAKQMAIMRKSKKEQGSPGRCSDRADGSDVLKDTHASLKMPPLPHKRPTVGEVDDVMAESSTVPTALPGLRISFPMAERFPSTFSAAAFPVLPVAPVIKEPDDPVKAWCRKWLRLPSKKLERLDEGTSKEKLAHRMLCWSVQRATKRPPRGLWTASQASCNHTRLGASVEFAASIDADVPEAIWEEELLEGWSPTPSPRHGATSFGIGDPHTDRAEARREQRRKGCRKFRDMAPIRFPGQFKEPHQNVDTASVSLTPEFAYVCRCERSGLVPCPAAWFRFADGVVDVCNRSLTDADAVAIVETAAECCEETGPVLLDLDLGGNLLTEEGLRKVAALLCSKIQVPDPALPFKSQVLESTRASSSSLQELHSLQDLSTEDGGAHTFADCADIHMLSSELALSYSSLPCESSPSDDVQLIEYNRFASLARLSFGGNTQIQLRAFAPSGKACSGTPLQELGRALACLPSLTDLNLCGVQLRGVAAAQELAAAVKRQPSIKCLNLSGCNLGASDQAECVALANLLGPDIADSETGGAWLGLVRADFSWNLFGAAGFAAAAAQLRRARLQFLSFAHNVASLRPVHEVNSLGEKSRKLSALRHGSLPDFNPIQLLIEGLGANCTVVSLDLTSTSLGPDSAFVLEEALRQHPSLGLLRVAENPLGEAGLRSVLRAVLSAGSRVEEIDVNGHREAEAFGNAMKYRFGQPGGMYHLNLRYPQDRAVLRSMLQHSMQKKVPALRPFKFEAKHTKPSVERDIVTGRWQVPTQGVFKFHFHPPVSVSAAALQDRLHHSAKEPDDTAQAESEPNMGQPKKRSSITEKPSFHVARTVRLGREENADILKPARPVGDDRLGEAANQLASADCRANIAHEVDWTEVLRISAECRILVSETKFGLVHTAFKSMITHSQRVRFIRAVGVHFSFRSDHVLQLCEAWPELQHFILKSLYPRIVGRQQQLTLVAGLEETRRRNVAKAVAPCTWLQEANLSGRYRFDLSEPAEYAAAETCLLVNAWESEVCRIAGLPDVSQRGNFSMLRNEKLDEVPIDTKDWILPSRGLLAFDYSSFRRPPPSTMPMQEATEMLKYLKSDKISSKAKLRALRTISPHLYLSSIQLQVLYGQCFPNREDLRHIQERRELFVILRTRVVDQAKLLGHELFSPDMLDMLNWEEVLRCVGHLHLMNPLSPEKLRWPCCLGVYEERRALEFLVHLDDQEPKGKVMCWTDDFSCCSVPASWSEKGVPCDSSQQLLVTYEKNVHYLPGHLLQQRQVLGQQFFIGSFKAIQKPAE